MAFYPPYRPTGSVECELVLLSVSAPFRAQGLICMSIRKRSPIFHLETAMAGCAFNIAPERASKLALLRDARNIILEVTDDTKFRIRVNPQRGNITVPVAAA